MVPTLILKKNPDFFRVFSHFSWLFIGTPCICTFWEESTGNTPLYRYLLRKIAAGENFKNLVPLFGHFIPYPWSKYHFSGPLCFFLTFSDQSFSPDFYDQYSPVACCHYCIHMKYLARATTKRAQILLIQCSTGHYYVRVSHVLACLVSFAYRGSCSPLLLQRVKHLRAHICANSIYIPTFKFTNHASQTFPRERSISI